MSNKSFLFQIGNFECILASDGTFAYPNPAKFFFVNASQERLEQLLREHNLDPEQWEQYVSPYSGLLINTGQHRVLVDTGAGSLAPTTGKLIPNLGAEGIAPKDVDTVILTHGHPDHIGGNVDAEGKPTFPNARYVMCKDEWEFWTSDLDLSPLKLGDWIPVILETARNNLPPIQGQLDLIEHETEIVPGIRAVPTPGHTPGHMAVAISSGGEQLLCIGDTPLHPINLEQPDWYAAVDLDPALIATTKRRLFDRAATEKAMVFGAHFPSPSLGHVIQKGEGWQWQPIETRG